MWVKTRQEYDCGNCLLDICPSDPKHNNPFHSKLRLMMASLPPTVWPCSFNPAIFDLTRALILAGVWVTKPDDLQAVKRLLMKRVTAGQFTFPKALLVWRRWSAWCRQTEKTASGSACNERYQLEGVDGCPHLCASTLLSCPPWSVGKTGPDCG